jgi:hypothetical protein
MNTRKIEIAVLLALLLTGKLLLANITLPPAPEVLKAGRAIAVVQANQPPKIDGILSSNEWPDSFAQGDFVLAATLWEDAKDQTIVRICRTDSHLYVAMECFDRTIQTIAARKDRSVWSNDVVEILLQPPSSQKESRWYHIAADAAGNIWFAYETIVLEMPGTYKGTLLSHQISSAVRTESDRWTVEISIPLADLNADHTSWNEKWRVNFCRTTTSPSTNSCWNMTQAFQNPENFGFLLPDKSKEAIANNKSYQKALHSYQQDRSKAVEAWKAEEPYYKFSYAFQFGPLKKEVQEGYISIDETSLYDRTKGYGWIGSVEGISSQTIADLGNARESRSKPAGALASSWVFATKPTYRNKVVHRFRVDLPPGEYKVHLLSGLLARELVPQRRAFTVSCNNKKVCDLDIGHFMYARPFFRCRAEKGRIEIAFEGESEIFPDPATSLIDPEGTKKVFLPGWLLNALVIYPAKDRVLAEKQIVRDESDLLYLPSEELMKVEKEEWKEEKGEISFSRKEMEQGLVLFERTLGERIYPNSRPLRSEIKESIEIRAVPGEPAYFSFGILPLKDLDVVSIEPTDLRGPKGIISKSEILLQEAQYRPWKIKGSRYAMEPVFLDTFRFLDPDMKKDECRWFWMSIKTPNQIKAGSYKGSVRIKGRNAKALQLRITLTVLPFHTVETPFRFGGFFPAGYGKPWAVYTDIWAKAFTENGINTLALYYDPYRAQDIRVLKGQLRIFSQYGLSGPFVVYTYIPGKVDQALRNGDISSLPEEVILKQIETAKLFLALHKEEGFPTLLYCAMDEAHCKGEPYWTEQIRLLTEIKKAVPEILTTASESSRSYWRSKDQLDVPLLFEVDDFREWRLSPEEIKKGKEIWSYPNQAMLEPADINAGRFCTGWLPAITGIRGILPWEIYEARDYNESWLKNTCWLQFVPRPIGGFRIEPRLTTVMGHIGIWDLRYVETMRALIAKAEQSNNPAAVAKAKELHNLLHRIDASTKGSYMYYYATEYWKPEIFTLLRQKVADGILALTELLEEKE